MTPLVSPSNEPTPAEINYGKGWKILIPFAVLPLVVVSVSVGVFLLFGLLANNQLGPSDYLSKMRSGSSHQKWQAAYELSRFLAQKNMGGDQSQFEKEMLSILKETDASQADLRRYLIIGLGQIGSNQSVPTLSEFIENDSDSVTKIYSIWALGRIGVKSSAPLIKKQTYSEDAGIRKTAGFTLGFVGTKSDEKRLEELLSDPIEDVRWNAALGLAQLGSSAGKHDLLQLADLEYVRSHTPNLRESERTQILLSAVNALGRLQLKEAEPPLQNLADHATDPALRLAAQNAIRILGRN